jgi:hypothetical protein
MAIGATMALAFSARIERGLAVRRDRRECRLTERADARDELGSIERRDLMAQHVYDLN